MREPVWVWWILFAVLIVVLWGAWSWRGPLIVLALWCLYELATIPSRCNISTRDGLVCAEPVRGRLFACTPAHQRLKTDQLFRLFRLANPLARPVAAPDPNRATGEIVWAQHMRGSRTAEPGQSMPQAPEQTHRILAQADERLILATAVATVVVIVGMVVGFVA